MKAYAVIFCRFYIVSHVTQDAFVTSYLACVYRRKMLNNFKIVKLFSIYH